MPWLVTHGTRDELLPIGPTREHVQSLQAAGIPVEWHEVDKGHLVSPRVEVPLIRDLIRRAFDGPDV
jgi:predicted esterase